MRIGVVEMLRMPDSHLQKTMERQLEANTNTNPSKGKDKVKHKHVLYIIRRDYTR